MWRAGPCSGGGALGENLGSVCRQDSQTLKSWIYICGWKYTFEYTNFAENNQALYSFWRKHNHLLGLYTDLDSNTPFLNRHNARNSLEVLTNYLSLSKNMKTLFFAQHTHLGLMFETQSSIWMNTWYNWVILLTLKYAVRVIFIPLDIPQLSPLENTEIGTALLHHVHGTFSRFNLVIIYKCKNFFEYPSHSFIYSPIYFHLNPPPPTPMIYIINEFLNIWIN